VKSQERAFNRAADATVNRGWESNRLNQEGAFGGGVTYDRDTGTQKTTLGTFGNEAAASLADIGQKYYGQAGQGVPDSMGAFNQAWDMSRQMMDPLFADQTAAKENQLRNQGLVPGTKAYDTALAALGRQQGDEYRRTALGLQNQMFGQSLQGRQQTMAELTPGVNAFEYFGRPQVTPYSQINTGGTFDAPGAMQRNYQQELANYNNQQAGWSGLLKTGLGLATAPLTGGLSLAGMGMNLMQGNPYNYGASWAPSVTRFG